MLIFAAEIIHAILLKKIDRYILKSFLVSFVFVLFLVLLITVVIDSSEKADDFSKSHLPFSKIITEYFAGFIPSIGALIFPLIVLITVIWCTSVLANRTEIVALFASGMSLRRFLRPYWVGGIILGLGLFFANGYGVPKAVKKSLAFKAKYIDPNLGGEKRYYDHINHYFKIGKNAYAGIMSYDTTSKTSYNFFVGTFDSTNNNMVSNLRSDLIKWDTASKKWRLENAIARTLSVKGEENDFLGAFDTAFNFKPYNLLLDEYAKQKLTNPDLDQLIAQEKIRQSDQVKELILEKHKRIAGGIAVLILTLMGAIIASKKIRGGSGMHLVKGLLIGALLILCDRFSTVFAVKGNLSPLVAAYLPSAVFAIYAYYLYLRAPK